jgi:hypothetical protein
MHLSQVKIVSRATSEGAGTQSSLTIYESQGLFGLPNRFSTCERSFGGSF